MIDESRKAWMAAVQAATERMRGGESDEEVVPLSESARMRIAEDPEEPGRITITCEGENAPDLRLRGFPAGPHRPEDYPDDAPFVPDCAVSVTELRAGKGRVFAFMKPEDPELALGTIRSACRDDAWSERELPVSPGPGFLELRQLVFERDGRQRVVHYKRSEAGAWITVMEEA